MTTGTLRTFIAAACRHLPLGAPGGLLPRRAYLSLVLAVSVLSPVVVLRGFVFHPLERIVSPRPAPNDRYGDPLVALGVLGRTWIRWDDGDFSRNDDRVFAPYPNVWAIAESSTALAAVGYPFYRLTGSFTFGYNAAYFLSCVLTALGAGLAFRMLAGPGWPALFGTILFLWCPGRLNNLGAIQTLWAGLNLFPLAFLLRFARSPSWRNASLGAASFTAVCLGSLYGGLMGAVLLALVAPVVLWPLRRTAGPWIRLGLAGTASVAFLAWFHAPLFDLGRDFDIRVSLQTFQGHAADGLSLFHHGVFSGPLRLLCDKVAPGLPEGSSALFPTVSLFVVGFASLLWRKRGFAGPRGGTLPARSAALWLSLAAVFFSFALGPTVRLAGRALFPGPYRLLVGLPGFSTMRGIHRWDQWFGLAVAAAVVLLAARLLVNQTEGRRRLLLLCLAPAVVLDVWPRYVPAQPAPGPSPFQDVYLGEGRDAVIGVYPIRHFVSEEAWPEQLFHRRRLINGFNSFPPPIHLWLDLVSRNAPARVIFLAYQELGAFAVEVHLDVLSPRELQDLNSCLQELRATGARVQMAGRRLLVVFSENRAPRLVDPGRIAGLVFRGDEAILSSSPGRLLFRLSGENLTVRVRAGQTTYEDNLTIPVVTADQMTARLGRIPPVGARIERTTGEALGTVPGPRDPGLRKDQRGDR
ncbi:MAG: hypothetical protein IPN83_11270 [Holophagales bacterium]|nr:hypothetical protein [Holophagales bacterium]